MQMQGSFDARNIEPKQSAGTNHPVGRFPFTVTDTGIEENKNKDGGFYLVEFTTPAGVAVLRYNMWNKNPQAVEIANGQLSALCHATGRYQLNWQDEGAAMRGAQGMIEVGFQKGQEPNAERPNGGYTEIKKVLDAAGNEPGKGPSNGATQQQQAPANQQQPVNQGGPMTSQPGGGWQQNGNPANTAQQGSGGGWQQNGGQTTQQQPPANQPPQGGNSGWQQGQGGAAQGGGNSMPPWSNRQ